MQSGLRKLCIDSRVRYLIHIRCSSLRRLPGVPFGEWRGAGTALPWVVRLRVARERIRAAAEITIYPVHSVAPISHAPDIGSHATSLRTYPVRETQSLRKTVRFLVFSPGRHEAGLELLRGRVLMGSPPDRHAEPPGTRSECPSCKTELTAPAKFCPACGAPLPARASALPRDPVDIRSRVDDSRGTLKRLQMLIPGYHGYRTAEDIRVADSLLRRQICTRIHNSVASLEGVRSELALNRRFDELGALPGLLSDLKHLEGEIRHAEQGYSGIAASVRVTPEELDRLYEYDYGFVVAADELATVAGTVTTTARSGNDDALAMQIRDARSKANQLEGTFRVRLLSVEKVLVP